MTDERLLASARRGDEAAFTELYLRYRDPLFRFGYRLTCSVEAAEDLVHDCFLALLRSPGRFVSGRASLRTYLYAAIRNLTRKRFRDELSESGEDEVEDPHRDCLSVLITEETACAVQQAVAAMPVQYREVLILAEYEELTMAEIAAIRERRWAR